MPGSELDESMHATFDRVLEPLERATAQRLNGPPRTALMAAFAESPDGFRACAEKALRRAHTNPVGLLVKMVVKDGEHRRAARSGTPEAPRTPLERWLTWAERTAPRLTAEHREEILEEASLSAEETERVRSAVERSLAEAVA